MEKKTQNERKVEQRDTSAEPKTFRLDRSDLRYVFCSLALLILLAWTLMNFGSVAGAVGKIWTLLFPFLLGGGMAFLMNTLLRPLEAQWDKLRRGKGVRLKRPICLSLSAVIVVGLLFAVAFIMIPSLRESGNEFVRNVPAYVEEIEQWWTNVVQFAAKYNVVLPEYAIDAEALTEKITAFINREGSGIITVTLGAATSILSGLIDVLLAFVFALYLLAQKEAVAAHLKRLTETVLPPRSARRFLSLVRLTNQTFSNFISGQLTEAVIIGVLCFAGMLLLRIPFAGAVSIFVAVTALIPIFGAWLGGGIGALLILLAEPVKAIWFVTFLLILQQLEGNLIYPKVVGKSVGLPGILVLMAVTIGGEAFGVLGMLFSVPVCAVLYSLYLEFMKNRPCHDTPLA